MGRRILLRQIRRPNPFYLYLSIFSESFKNFVSLLELSSQNGVLLTQKARTFAEIE